MDPLICDKCFKSFEGIESLKNHYRKDHLISLTNPVSSGYKCCNGGCRQRHFCLFSSFIRHLREKHVSINNEITNQIDTANPGLVILDNSVMDVENLEENQNAERIEEDLGIGESSIQEEEEQFNVSNNHSNPMNVSASACKMIASLRLNHSFSGSHIDVVIDESNTFINESLEYVKIKV